jgi:acyl carrier protein
VTLNSSLLVDDVKAVVVETLGLEDRADAIGATTTLYGSVPELDSMAVLELVAALEERFDITLEDDEISADAFENLASLAAVVGRTRGH